MKGQKSNDSDSATVTDDQGHSLRRTKMPRREWVLPHSNVTRPLLELDSLLQTEPRPSCSRGRSEALSLCRGIQMKKVRFTRSQNKLPTNANTRLRTHMQTTYHAILKCAFLSFYYQGAGNFTLGGEEGEHHGPEKFSSSCFESLPMKTDIDRASFQEKP